MTDLCRRHIPACAPRGMKKGPVGSRAPAGCWTLEDAKKRARNKKKGRSFLDWNSHGTKGTFDEHEGNATDRQCGKEEDERRQTGKRERGKKENPAVNHLAFARS